MNYSNSDLIGNSWNCACGAMNAAYLNNCGNCKETKPKNNE